MKPEKIVLPSDRPDQSFLLRFPREDSDPRPAVLVIPGGGYHAVCEDTEGSPVARRFDAMGFRTFVLSYRIAPCPVGAPLEDARAALRLIREHAAEWGVKPDEIAACGFSAGGHLAGSLGIFLPPEERPNGLVLCYPVVTAREKTADGKPLAHGNSSRSYYGHQDLTEAERAAFSLDENVDAAVPPTFLWTTPEDTLVPMENSFRLARALHAAGRPCELHVFPHGPHGMQLGYGRSDIAQWPSLAAAFLRDTCGFRLPPAPGETRRTVVLTFDDAVKNHLDFVAPLLRRYGFGATFFITRFSDEWRQKYDPATLLTQADVKALSDQGFEIGNHTWNHACGMDDLDDATAAAEFDRLDAWLAEAGVPQPVVYAYPGGPYSAKGAALAKARGYIGARSTAQSGGFRIWNPAADDPFSIPHILLQHGSDWDFYHAFADANGPLDPTLVPVFVTHGVPDRNHPWVNTEPGELETFLAFLAGHGCRVIGLAQALREFGPRV